jgi:hypothetical protein
MSGDQDIGDYNEQYGLGKFVITEEIWDRKFI